VESPDDSEKAGNQKYGAADPAQPDRNLLQPYGASPPTAIGAFADVTKPTSERRCDVT
jgi:hypothetical protein